MNDMHDPDASTRANASTALHAAWAGGVESVLAATDPDAFHWDETADLVIVGFGGAGIAAALEAAEGGAQVIAVDHYEGGGSTAANGGVFYAGGGTRIQREAGEDDSPEEMYKYLKLEVGDVVRDDTLHRFCAESVATVDWLLDHGAQLNSRVYRKKTSYPPLDYFLYHSDSSLAAPYARRAKPAARGHRAFTRNGKKAWGLGRGIVFPLRDAALKAGAVFHPYAEAHQLVVDRARRVVGVKVSQLTSGSRAARRFARYVAAANWLFAALPSVFPGAFLTLGLGQWCLARARKIEARHRVTRWIRARRGVLLSTGGFIMNKPMLEHHAPRYAGGMPLGTLGDTGAGILLGQSAGGALQLMDQISAWRFFNPPAAWARAMLVNARGQRFCNETLYGASIGRAIVEGQGGKAWLVYDAGVRRDAFRQAFDRQTVPFQRQVTLLNLLFNTRKAASLDELADRMGFDRKTLRDTMESNNRVARGEAADPFERRTEETAAFADGPCYATDVSLDSRLMPLPVLTVGGLRVDEDSGRVLDGAGQPIAGLYAAGRTAVGICSNIYVSGLSFADCVFSGRRAARDILQHAARDTAAIG